MNTSEAESAMRKRRKTLRQGESLAVGPSPYSHTCSLSVFPYPMSVSGCGGLPCAVEFDFYFVPVLQLFFLLIPTDMVGHSHIFLFYWLCVFCLFLGLLSGVSGGNGVLEDAPSIYSTGRADSMSGWFCYC